MYTLTVEQMNELIRLASVMRNLDRGYTAAGKEIDSRVRGASVIKEAIARKLDLYKLLDEINPPPYPHPTPAFFLGPN